MREILFRGKRTDGKWEIGYYFAKPILEKHFIIYDNNQWLVTPETVGQFTGLTDKRGEKIFEGDIVRCGTGRICKVTFFISPGFGGFDLVAIGGFDAPAPHNWALFADTEVIGNIHDNPEFLED